MTDTAPHTRPLTLRQGMTFSHTVACKTAAGGVYDLTGATARAVIRYREGAAGDPLVDLTAANSRIVIDVDAGTVQMVVSNTDTAALDIGTSVKHWWYVLWLAESGGYVRELMSGVMIARPD